MTFKPPDNLAALIQAARSGYDPEDIDRLARRQREELGELDVDHPRVYKLRCNACSIFIGPGFLHTEVWCDLSTGKAICRSCAHWIDRPTDRVISAEEVTSHTIPQLAKIIPARCTKMESAT